jgi:DNA-binding transcriptional MerR regulator
MTGKALTLKDMIDGSGCTARTVRYYEREGLLRATRTSGGHRLFAPVELERLRFIIQLREAGWALDEVTEFLAVREPPKSDLDAWTQFDRLLALQIDRLERKIEILGQLRADLGQTAALLPVCRECVHQHDAARRPDCGECERMPPLATLPASFRLSWRARELDAAAFDEPDADGLPHAPDTDADDADASLAVDRPDEAAQ